MGTAQRDSAKRGAVRALTMITALFGGGMGVSSDMPAQGWADDAITGRGPNDIGRARYKGKLRRAAWRKMHGGRR